MDYFFVAIAAIAFIAITFAVNWFQSTHLQRRAIAQSIETTNAQYLAAVAAQLAAPHMSPDPRHTEENRLILDHWVNFTRQMFKNGTLPS